MMLRTLLRRPIAVTMTLIAIVTLGVLAFQRIPVSLMPDIDVPRIVVQMSAQGSSAREIEQQIVSPMHQQLSQVSGLKSIESTSRTDAGIITLTFDPGSDMSLLFIEVNEKIDRAMSYLPKDMERPKAMKIGAMDIPAFYVDITGGKPEQTSRLIRNVISKRLEQLPEVAMVDYSGMVGTQITILPDEMKMRALGISNSDIEKAISDNNIVLAALSIRNGIYRYSIHFDSQIISVHDIEDIYLQIEGRLLQLKDICKVEESAAERKGSVTSDGHNAITMAVIKQSDAQMSSLQSRVDTLMSDLGKDYPELKFNITRDQTQLLSYSMSNLEWNLILGIITASVVLFLFIGGWRLPLLVVISIPISLILTLLCFYLMDISLNIISLSGLILGVGMIVDNAIIVIDNIRQKGKATDNNIVDAVKEVIMPMFSSVLTTCSVFIPLIFLSGTAGALFYDQAMGISIALFCSLAVAALVVPVYYFLLCKKHKMLSKKKSTIADKLNIRLSRYYESGMRYTLRHSKQMLVFFSVCIVAIVVLFPYLRKERMPEIAHDDALITIDWNAGITPEENNRRMAELLKEVKPFLETSTTMVGGQDFILSHTKNITSSEAVCYLKCKSADELDEATQKMQKYIGIYYPNAKIETGLAANIFDMIFSTEEPDLQVRLHRRDGGRPAVELTKMVTDSLRAHFPQLGIQPVSTELYIKYTADAEQMAYYKVSYQQLYSRLKELLGSNSIYDINSGGESVPVVIGNNGKDAKVLLSNTIRNADGIDIPISYLVREQHADDYKHLYASDEGEFSVINIDKAKDGEVKDVMTYVTSLTDNDKNGRLQASFVGSYFSSRMMIGELVMVLVVALLLLYFILAAQFESIIQPMIILVEVVVDVALVLFAVWVVGESLNIMSMIGMVVMCGIIINDSILKVDTINRIYRSVSQSQKHTLLKAIMVAGHRRLKPIVMTSLTTILAIVPFLHRGDMGSALQFPLSFTIIVGMIVGTMVSLFFVPLVYYMLYRK
ncbi:MAG TPA: RND transporter [Prevotella sp.]|nr:efflux RND transporter permease subunit [Prevotella sp.]HCN52501.1 RND transporter [Prevotella sp.]